MNRTLFLLAVLIIFFMIEYYVFRIIRDMVFEKSMVIKYTVYISYWFFSTAAVLGVLFYDQLDPQVYRSLRLFITSFFFINLVSKLLASLILLGDDFRRVFAYLFQFFTPVETKVMPQRAEFIGKAALIAGAVPLTVFSFGILSGAHDYRVRKRIITSSNLPKAFDGIRIVQISDIHTGSFFNKKAVAGGVDLINAQKPDIVMFTGDLVNNESDEAVPYLDVFKKVSAPMGVFSTMGNHDYGDYKGWASPGEKQNDIKKLHEMHRYMGWDILLNENRRIKVNGEEIGLLGVENWGAGRFSKYGDLAKTHKGLEDIPYKILMSHDPSHWDAQVRTEYPDVDLMLAGHTHGMQLGIEIGDFRWSPSQYIYKQWADLYQEGHQYLYVNRGFGFIGYPGRIGILPEITVLELKRA